MQQASLEAAQRMLEQTEPRSAGNGPAATAAVAAQERFGDAATADSTACEAKQSKMPIICKTIGTFGSTLALS